MLVTEDGHDQMSMTENSSIMDTVSLDYFTSDFSTVLDSDRYFPSEMDTSLHTEEDFLQHLTDNLEIPMLLDEPVDNLFEETPCEDFPSLEDFNDVDLTKWNPDAFPNLCAADELQASKVAKQEFKLEPPSPCIQLPPSPSNSSDSSHSELWSGGEQDVKFLLETPPISPPQTQDGSPPTTPVPNTTNDSVVMVSPIKIVPVSSNGLNVGSNPKIVITKQIPSVGKEIKIQPKTEPSASSPFTSACMKNATVQKVIIPKCKEVSDSRQAIVLTAKDLEALTQKVKSTNGASPTVTVKTIRQPIKTEAITFPIQVSSNKVPVVNKPMSAITSIPFPTATRTVVRNSPPMSSSSRQEMELKALKRQQRMIKNRESACLSRKKKKEYVTSLENQLAEVQKENIQLKLENSLLKERLASFEEGQTRTKKSQYFSSTKKTTALLAVLLMVSFNLSSLSGFFPRSPQHIDAVQTTLTSLPYKNNPKTGRSLLWNNYDLDSYPDSGSSLNNLNSILNSTSGVHPTCPMYINQTESIRLDNDLRGWFGTESDEGIENHTQPKQEPKSLGELLIPPVSQKKLAKKKISKRKKSAYRQPDNSRELEVYSLRPHYYNYAAFFDAIHRRDDTFYVVSFSGDHLLLPATAHNRTIRPKMSLVLPTVPFNESMQAPPHHISMMQIDCEVMNTRLLHIKEVHIPAHLRRNDTYYNSTGSYDKDKQNFSPKRTDKKPAVVSSERFSGPTTRMPLQAQKTYFEKLGRKQELQDIDTKFPSYDLNFNNKFLKRNDRGYV